MHCYKLCTHTNLQIQLLHTTDPHESWTGWSKSSVQMQHSTSSGRRPQDWGIVYTGDWWSLLWREEVTGRWAAINMGDNTMGGRRSGSASIFCSVCAINYYACSGCTNVLAVFWSSVLLCLEWFQDVIWFVLTPVNIATNWYCNEITLLSAEFNFRKYRNVLINH